MAALLAATVFSVSSASSQEPLSFLGFRPGAARGAAEQVIRQQHGSWSCSRSTVDPRFTECFGRIAPEGEPALDLTASLVHDTVAVLLLSGAVVDADLQRWRATLASRVGPAAVRGTQGQTVWQWIRSRQMIRITTRAGGKPQIASVSLVDGTVLDGLGEPRSK